MQSCLLSQDLGGGGGGQDFQGQEVQPIPVVTSRSSSPPTSATLTPLSEAWRSFSAALQHLPPSLWTQLSLGGQGVCSSNIHLCEVWGYQVPVLGPSARPHVSWASSR